MRMDESGQPCPATLFEYRDLCKAIGGPTCAAVQLLEKKIADNGGLDDTIIAADSQMRALLMPLLITDEMPDAHTHAQLSARFLATFGKEQP